MFPTSAPVRRLAGLALCVAALAMLQACGGSGRAATTANLTTSNTISISVCATCSTVMQVGGSTTLEASVVIDPNKQGVTWSLTGPGTLSDATTTSVKYNAPAAGTVTGAATAQVTATGIHDTTVTASATLRVDGTPVAQATTFFPGNNGTAYGASVTVQGGLAPFTWSVSSGALPAGITISTASTSLSYLALTGTPTQEGVFPFQLKVTDANSATSTVDLSITILPHAACLLSGRYVQLETGYDHGASFVAASSYSVDGAGVVSGQQDKGVGGASAVAESFTGTCTTRTANNGVLTFTGTARKPVYDYAVNITLAHGRVQLTNGGDSVAANGRLYKQDATAFAQAALAGDWSFGLLGAYVPASTLATGNRVGVAGRFTLGATGAATAGRLDANGSTPLAAAAFTGNMSAPDATSGRGTLTLTGAGFSYAFVYYVVNANEVLLLRTDTSSGVPVLAGTMTRQSGTFDGSSLAGPSVFSLWSGYGTEPPFASLALGRLSGAVATSATAGTLTVGVDTADHATATLGKSYTGATYAMDATTPDGRGTVTYTDSNSVAHSLVLYLDGPGNGYVVESGSSHGMAGVLEAQAAGPYNYSTTGLFLGGTQYPADEGPIMLVPTMAVVGGTLSSTTSSSIFSGYVAFDTASGRGIGTASVVGVTSVISSYQVTPTEFRLLRYGYLLRSPTFEWISN